MTFRPNEKSPKRKKTDRTEENRRGTETLKAHPLISLGYWHTIPNGDYGRELLWGWALPPCCKAYALTPHPFIYAPFGVLTGRRPT
jgi:hypothetical protein